MGEEVELLFAAPGERLSRGRARVVGSERVFGRLTELTAGGLRLTASGYRLAWAEPDARLRAVIDRCQLAQVYQAEGLPVRIWTSLW